MLGIRDVGPNARMRHSDLRLTSRRDVACGHSTFSIGSGRLPIDTSRYLTDRLGEMQFLVAKEIVLGHEILLVDTFVYLRSF